MSIGLRFKQLALFFAIGLILLSTSACPPSEVIHSRESLTAFVNVSVITMDSDRVLEGQTVLTSGDRINEIGPTAEVHIPDGATRIDGTGKFLLPGLAEMHGHIPPPSAPTEFTEHVLFLYLANGITTVRGMLGFDGQLALRERANAGDMLSPTLYLAGPSFNGSSVRSPEQAEEMVRQQVLEGWNLLKIHPGPSLAEFDAMARTANALGIRYGGHVPESTSLPHALEMGQETFDHLDGYERYVVGSDGKVDPERMAEAVQLTLDANAAVVPTMALWENLFGTRSLDELEAYPELVYFPPSQVTQWRSSVLATRAGATFSQVGADNFIENRLEILRALHEGGVTILMGTDAPQLFSVPGFSLHRELERMAEAGMSNFAILKSGTRNVGDYFANEDVFGLVEEGHRADLLLAPGNPLEDLAHLQQLDGVMVRGHWVPRSTIQQRLDESAARFATSGP